MSATASITNVCQIAETFGAGLGLAKFEIDRIVHNRSDGKDEWVLQLRFVDVDPLVEDDAGAIIIVDAETERARLVQGL